VQKYTEVFKIPNIFGQIYKKAGISFDFQRIIRIFAQNKYLKQIVMEPKLGDMMKVNPSLTGLTDWIEGQVIDVEHNPFMGLVISIKDNLGRIFFGQSKYFKIA
jgi:hypothetical protein